MKLIFPLVLLIALAFGAWRLLEWRNLPPEVPFTTATRETISSSVSTNGKAVPSEYAQARSEVSGRVDKILVSLRQRVEAGAPLVELDTAELHHGLEAADARIAGVKSNLAVLDAGGRQPEKLLIQTEIDNAEVELKAAQADYDTEVRLESKGAATREQVTIRKNRVDSLRSTIRGLSQRLGSLVAPTDRNPLEAQLRQEEANRKQILLRIEQSTVRAPIAGSIYQFDLKPGAYLNPGDVVASIGRLETVHVLVYVDEPDLGRIRRGLPVTITWDASPGREWSGTVDRLPTEIKPLDSRQVGEVTCVIRNPGLDLIPGTNVNARILAETASNAITIPKEAIFRENGQTGVYLLSGDRLEWHPLTQGVSNVTRTQVMELQEGQQVALPSDRPLSNGMLVRPRAN